jgi:hypothetical protein
MSISASCRQAGGVVGTFGIDTANTSTQKISVPTAGILTNPALEGSVGFYWCPLELGAAGHIFTGKAAETAPKMYMARRASTDEVEFYYEDGLCRVAAPLQNTTYYIVARWSDSNAIPVGSCAVLEMYNLNGTLASSDSSACNGVDTTLDTDFFLGAVNAAEWFSIYDQWMFSNDPNAHLESYRNNTSPP